MGLAHAFLIAGSSVVVAPTRPVDDTLTRELMKRLYAELSAGHSLAAALQRAQASLARDLPSSDWSAFRAIAR
jgi:CHAT domain-containing protein